MFCVVALCSTLRSETRPAPQERTSAMANYSATLHLTNSRALVLVSYKELLSISLLAMHWCHALKLSATQPWGSALACKHTCVALLLRGSANDASVIPGQCTVQQRERMWRKSRGIWLVISITAGREPRRSTKVVVGLRDHLVRIWTLLLFFHLLFFRPFLDHFNSICIAPSRRDPLGRGVASIMIVRRTEGCAREGDPSFCPLPRVASTRSCVCRTWRRGIFPLPAVVSHRYWEGQLFFLIQVGTCSFWQAPSIDN